MVIKLEKQTSPILLESKNNVFLIDWLTFVAHGDSVDYIKWLLGLDGPDIPWETSEKFRNGYPQQCYWNGITISYGADDERFYKDPSKVRLDMGICVNLSGSGCRTYESFGKGDWKQLFAYLLRDTSELASANHVFKRYNITRLDLAYDDHIGLLDLKRIETDVRERNYISRAKYAEVIWSDNQDSNIQGMTIQIGSDKSAVKIRMYDKASERGFKDRHWVRCEIQLRDERALVACTELHKHQHIGMTAAGILRNYLTFREPNNDTNPSRWPLADYWDKLLLDMERVRLWISPGEPYNFSKTEHWLCKQYGQAIVVLDQLHDPEYLLERCRKLYPLEELAPKYRKFLAELEPKKKPFDIVDDKTPWDTQEVMEEYGDNL